MGFLLLLSWVTWVPIWADTFNNFIFSFFHFPLNSAKFSPILPLQLSPPSFQIFGSVYAFWNSVKGNTRRRDVRPVMDCMGWSQPLSYPYHNMTFLKADESSLNSTAHLSNTLTARYKYQFGTFDITRWSPRSKQVLLLTRSTFLAHLLLSANLSSPEFFLAFLSSSWNFHFSMPCWLATLDLIFIPSQLHVTLMVH